MIHLTADTQILIATSHVDFRRGIDGLASLCEQQLEQSPHSGAMFVFINRAHTMIRILCYEEQGFWLATKRLSRGRYNCWPKITEGSQPLTSSALQKILTSFVAKRSRQV